MNTVKALQIVSFLMFMALFACNKEKSNVPPSIHFMQPAGNLIIEKDTVINFLVEATDPDGEIKQVVFLINDYIVQWNHMPPYEYQWYDAKLENSGIYSIKAVAHDNEDATSSAEIQIEIFDFRNIYFGNYHFTIITSFWVLGGQTTYDTSEYLGLVRRFALEDNEDNLFVNDDPNENPNQKITIQFLPDRKITSIINSEGILTPKSGYHYYHYGNFIHPDTLVFSVGGLGGLGYGYGYSVSGFRVE